MTKQEDGSYTADVVGRYFGPESVDEADRHPITRVNIFYPEGEGPFGIVIVASLAAFQAGDMRDTITTTQSVAHRLLEAGVAVAWFVPPVARGPNTSNNIDDGSSFDPGAGLFGAPYRGNGVTYSPQGWPEVGAFPPDYDDEYPSRPHPWLDDLWLMAEKSCQWLVQHLKHNAAALGLTGKVGGYSTSAGAISLMRALYAPDQADASETGQKTASSRLDVASLQGCGSYHLHYSYANFTGRHWPDPASSPHYDQPAATVGTVVTPLVAMINYTGAVYYGQTSSALIQQNEAVPVNFHFAAPPALGTFGTYSKSIPDLPRDVETDPHSSWFGYLLKFVFGGAGNVRLTVTSAASDPGAPAQAAHDAVLDVPDDVFADQAATLIQVLAVNKTPAEEQVIAALEETLAGVTASNGFLTDVQGVHRFPDLPEHLATWPVIEVRRAECSKDDRAFANVTKATLRVELALVLGTWEQQELRMSRFIADVEKALAADCTLGGRADSLFMSRDERVQMSRDGSQVSVAFADLVVTFRYLKSDPYTLHSTPGSS